VSCFQFSAAPSPADGGSFAASCRVSRQLGALGPAFSLSFADSSSTPRSVTNVVFGILYKGTYTSEVSTRVSNSLTVGTILGQIIIGLLCDLKVRESTWSIPLALSSFLISSCILFRRLLPLSASRRLLGVSIAIAKTDLTSSLNLLRKGRKWGIVISTVCIVVGIILSTGAHGAHGSTVGLFWFLTVSRGLTGEFGARVVFDRWRSSCMVTDTKTVPAYQA
jgi:hypothetical protein